MEGKSSFPPTGEISAGLKPQLLSPPHCLSMSCCLQSGDASGGEETPQAMLGTCNPECGLAPCGSAHKLRPGRGGTQGETLGSRRPQQEFASFSPVRHLLALTQGCHKDQVCHLPSLYHPVTCPGTCSAMCLPPAKGGRPHRSQADASVRLMDLGLLSETFALQRPSLEYFVTTQENEHEQLT